MQVGSSMWSHVESQVLGVEEGARAHWALEESLAGLLAGVPCEVTIQLLGSAELQPAVGPVAAVGLLDWRRASKTQKPVVDPVLYTYKQARNPPASIFMWMDAVVVAAGGPAMLARKKYRNRYFSSLSSSSCVWKGQNLFNWVWCVHWWRGVTFECLTLTLCHWQ